VVTTRTPKLFGARNSAISRSTRLLAKIRTVTPSPSTLVQFRAIVRVCQNWPVVLLLRTGVLSKARLRLRDHTTLQASSQSCQWLLQTDLRVWRLRLRSAIERGRLIAGDGYYAVLLDGPEFQEELDATSGVTQLRLWFSSEAEEANCLSSLEAHFLRKTKHGTGMYGMLDVAGRDVLDVGANIGDSALYFASRGAKRVIALEPFPKMYARAKRNIEGNRQGQNIVLLNEGAGARSVHVRVPPALESNGGSALRDFGVGQEVKVSSLDELVERFRIYDGILKSNCEGCEYPFLLTSSKESRLRFSQMLIEYHHGPDEIVRQLTADGFRVSYKRPILLYDSQDSTRTGMLAGKIFAERLA
jgi:FkbM family methyltransferase